MRLIDADDLKLAKFHGYPEIEITPSDVDAEAYKRGWNDAINAIMGCAPTIEPERKKGRWEVSVGSPNPYFRDYFCSCCNLPAFNRITAFCPNCGAEMRSE